MAKKPVQKILRIGLFSSGKFIEERLIHSRKAVTAGSDFNKKSTFIVPASKLPPQMSVFDVDREGNYVLLIPKGMGGTISTGDGSYSIEQLIRDGKAKKEGDVYKLALTPKFYGRIAFGSGDEEVAFLFQFVTPPPPRARPVLPANMRGGIITGILASTILFVTISISAVVQVGFIAFLLSRDWPEPKDLEYQMPDRFVSLMVKKEEEPEPEPEPVEAEEGEGPGEEAEEEASEPAPAEEEPEEKEPKTAAERAAEEAERRQKLAEQVREKTILARVGALSSDGNIVDALADGAGRTSMEDAFANSSGITTEAAGAEKSGLRTGGSSSADGKGTSVGIESLGASKGAKEASKGVKTGSKTERKVKARVKAMPEKVVGTGTLDAGSIGDTIKRRMRRIQSCYERQLKKDPNSGGKVIVQFTIGTAGRVTKSKSTTDSVGGGVGTCVAGQIQRIRFPRPKGGEVLVNKTFIFEASK